MCSTFSLWIVCEGIIYYYIFGYSCISNPTGTNKPNFSCLLSILHMWKKSIFYGILFFKLFMFNARILFVCVYYYLTRFYT